MTDQQTKISFTSTLKNRFQILQDMLTEDTNVHTLWEELRDTIKTTCSEELGLRKAQHKEWISAETLQRVQRRKQMKKAINISRTRTSKAAVQTEYTKVHKEVKQSLKKDKRKYYEDMADKAEQAAYSGNTKELYDLTRKGSSTDQRDLLKTSKGRLSSVQNSNLKDGPSILKSS